jgi:hypothetical protein
MRKIISYNYNAKERANNQDDSKKMYCGNWRMKRVVMIPRSKVGAVIGKGGQVGISIMNI